MLIDKKHKFIFLYFQKTASKYVRRILAPLGGFSTAEVSSKGVTGYIKDLNYMKSNNIIADISFDITDYYTFGVIRNPFEWYLSLFVYSKEWQHLDEHQLFGNLPTMSFDEFMNRALNCKEFFQTRSNEHRNINCIRLFKTVRNGKLDAGWFTYKYIYTYFLDWENIIMNMTLEEFEEKHDFLVSAEIFPIEKLDEDIHKILDTIGVSDKINNDFLSRHNVNSYDRNRYTWYPIRMTQELLVKDSILFNLYYKEEKK